MAKKKRVIIKTWDQIKRITESWKYLTELLYLIAQSCKMWVTLIELEKIAQQYITRKNVKWAFKWYHGFPANLCLSVNDCVVHWIPDRYVLKNWDVLKIDCWINYKWGISDSAICMVIWWEMANPEWFALIKATKDALDLSLKYVQPGKKIFEYANSLYTHVKQEKFSILENLAGHGVGVELHEPPYIYNYPHPDTKRDIFRPGMVVALEPITAVTSKTTVEKIGIPWNLYTKWGDIWAQWEYMLLITQNWNKVLSWITEDIYLS